MTDKADTIEKPRRQLSEKQKTILEAGRKKICSVN